MRYGVSFAALLLLSACAQQPNISAGAEIRAGSTGTTVSPNVEFRRGNVGVAVGR